MASKRKRKCKHCKNLFLPKRKDSICCSPSCRESYKRGSRKSKPTPRIKCEQCGSDTTNKRWCSRTCQTDYTNSQYWNSAYQTGFGKWLVWNLDRSGTVEVLQKQTDDGTHHRLTQSDITEMFKLYKRSTSSNGMGYKAGNRYTGFQYYNWNYERCYELGHRHAARPKGLETLGLLNTTNLVQVPKQLNTDASNKMSDLAQEFQHLNYSDLSDEWLIDSKSPKRILALASRYLDGAIESFFVAQRLKKPSKPEEQIRIDDGETPPMYHDPVSEDDILHIESLRHGYSSFEMSLDMTVRDGFKYILDCGQGYPLQELENEIDDHLNGFNPALDFDLDDDYHLELDW